MESFTLIEVLIVIAVIFILSFIVFSSYFSFRSQTEVNSGAQEVLNVLRLAQSKTLASEAASNYGVHFEQEKIVLFKGIIYSAVDPNNKVYDFSQVEAPLSDISLNGGGNEVVFERITGYTANYGTVKIQSKRDSNKFLFIKIESSGEVAIKGTDISFLGSRIVDSRHIHFTYNRNIDIANETITLTFNDPLTVQNIKISDYLDTGQINWQGKVTVGADDQIIHIHTHQLNNPDTLFCVHRDQRYNNKPLTITISGEAGSLIGYTADGQESRGTSIYLAPGEAGEPQRQ